MTGVVEGAGFFSGDLRIWTRIAPMFLSVPFFYAASCDSCPAGRSRHRLPADAHERGEVPGAEETRQRGSEDIRCLVRPVAQDKGCYESPGWLFRAAGGTGSELAQSQAHA